MNKTNRNQFSKARVLALVCLGALVLLAAGFLRAPKLVILQEPLWESASGPSSEVAQQPRPTARPKAEETANVAQAQYKSAAVPAPIPQPISQPSFPRAVAGP